jgi:hypothetical protein|tara:strand:- start:741 stop:1448 length:708 start_codon:yes stop_codon:yes gene_type:complete
MANIEIIDGNSQSKYVKATGAGSSGDPFITQQLETNSATIQTNTGTTSTNTTTIVTSNAAIQTAVEGTLKADQKFEIVRKQINVTRAGASAVSVAVNGIIEASGNFFHELTTVASSNGDAVILKNIRIGTSGGAESSIGNLNIFVMNSVPSSAQTEGSDILLTGAETEYMESKVAVWNKTTSTSASVHLSDDSSDYLIHTAAADTSLYLCIQSASAWSVTGSEDFKITCDFYRVE